MHGTNVITVNKDNNTTLHYAAQSRSDKIVKVLVEHGAEEVKAINKDYKTALNYAAQSKIEQDRQSTCQAWY